ncbi:MAG: DUF2779 domain-containing protein [Candidatus Hermodarchaeota archaeon]
MSEKTMQDEPEFLTKTAFINGRDCPRKFYYMKDSRYTNKFEDDPQTIALQEAGYVVGELAKLYHPGGHDIKTLDEEDALKQTKELLKQENVIIFEAAIKYGKFFIRVDVLIKRGNELELNEVKSSSIDSTDYSFTNRKGYLSSNYERILHDIAFQTYIVQKALPDYTITPNLMLVDKSKRATVDGLNELFRLVQDEKGRTEVQLTRSVTKVDLGEELLVKMPVMEFIEMIWNGTAIDPDDQTEEDKKPFAERIKEYADYYTSDEKRPVQIGEKCQDCEYRVSDKDMEPGEINGYKECWKECLGWTEVIFKKPHVFEVWNLRSVGELLEQGVYLMEDIDIEETFMTEKDGELVYKSKTAKRQVLQIKKTLDPTDNSEHIDHELFKEIDCVFPLHFIDFETTNLAIPNHKGRRPYDQIAFQFSIHTLYEDGRVEHDAEWISTEKALPNFEFVRQLKKALEKDEGTIVHYGAHENTVLREIYEQLEEEQEHVSDAVELMKWIDTITKLNDEEADECRERSTVDMLNLVKNYYYHPEMRGSNSIKAVLPAVLSTSDFLRDKYTTPYYSKNYTEGIIWYQRDENGYLMNPYDLLQSEIKEGLAASNAYIRMLFEEVSEEERKKIVAELLRYCELDTLAMVMIYEHWRSLTSK